MALKDFETRKEYQAAYIRQHYLDNKQYYKDKKKAWTALRVPKLYAFVNRYKRWKTCQDCGFNNPVALQFHHLRDKTQAIAILVKQGVSFTRLKNEIRKCIVLCANCHAIRHHVEKMG